MRVRTMVILAGGFALSACQGEAPGTESAATAASRQPEAALRSPAPDGALVYFFGPTDGAEVRSPVNVVFGLRGAGIAPAGIDLPNTGHHHLLVDTELGDFAAPIPADEQHIHFGLGQTETTIELAPGTHTLQLALGDHLHIPHEPPLLSRRITVTVVE